MFNLPKSETFNPFLAVDNQLKNVGITLFLNIKSIDVYCYK